ncbi:MAG: LPS export ABC transporter permease LptF, partial [Deltaproteobacteria bacterium]|nr:LPS export ABC transporter permease LptF [Deltaproteobacteria bacterium]
MVLPRSCTIYVLAPFFASFLILYGVFFLVRLIPLLEVVLELGINFSDFVRLFSYIFPHLLLYVIPMASMAGIIIGFTRLTNDREILALKACGISLRQMLPPVIMVAAVIASLTGYFSIRLIPAGEIAMRQLMFQLAKEKIDKGIKEKKFTEALGDLVVYVDQIDEKNQWTGVFVSDMRDRLQPIITMAKNGYMEADVQNMGVTIVLNNGTLHNTDGKDNQVIRFSRYQLQIPLKPPTRIGGDDVTQIGKGAMSQQQLLDSARQYGPDTKKGIIFLAEYHHRLVLPVGCFLLSLLGLPLGLQAGPGRKAAGIPLGLGFFVLYYVTFTMCRTLVEDMALPLVFGMWLPNIIFAAITILIFWRVEQERPIFSEKLIDFITDLKEKYLTPR